VRLYGGVAGEQLDPCYHLFCDRLSSILDAPPVDVLANPASAKKCCAAAGARWSSSCRR
jgi:hypothetical protein